LLHEGSGWGALERRRRERANEPPSASSALPCPKQTVRPEQTPWLELLEKGELPPRPASLDAGSLMVQPQWRDLLEQSVAQGNQSAHWLASYHLGVMRYRAGDLAA